MSHDHLAAVTALAGVYQSIDAVIQIARQGKMETAVIEPCIYSLFQIDAVNVDAVFGAPGAVVPGAKKLVTQFTGIPERNLEMTRYAIHLMRLERNLSRHAELRQRIGAGVAAAVNKRDHFGLLHTNIFAHFADLYQETLSQLKPRILIRGEAVYLRDSDHQQRIRALLLAGVRAAMLWQQVGGSRWQILFKNKQILNEAQQYLQRYAG
ncbi:lysogenization regulator HflD [Chromatium weissei]|nr:lysogenization regulator HflD [Chromatium weissei]